MDRKCGQGVFGQGRGQWGCVDRDVWTWGRCTSPPTAMAAEAAVRFLLECILVFLIKCNLLLLGTSLSSGGINGLT